MPLTPSEEREYQRLGTELGFLGGAGSQPYEEDYGTLGFAGRTLANMLPGAFEKIIQPAQALLGMDEQSDIPRFFDMRAPKSTTEKVIGGAGQLAEYLPAIIGTEGAAAAGLARAGMGAGTARLAASGLGFGLPMANHGPETAINQGAVGVLQSGAQHLGWRGKVAAGLLGGGIGYYEGAKGPDGSPEQGAIFGALNLLGPTVIDPLVNKLTGFKPGAQAGGAPIPGQPHGPVERPDIVRTGQAGLPFAMDDALAAAQQTAKAGSTYDVFAGLQDKPASMYTLNHGPAPQPNGIPFWEVPDPMGLRLAGSNGEGVVIQAADPAHVEPATLPGGRRVRPQTGTFGQRVRRTDYPPAARAGEPTADLMQLGGGGGGNLPDEFPVGSGPFTQTGHMGLPFGIDEAQAAAQHGMGANVYDIFGERGVHPPPIMSQGETFPGGGVFPQAPLTPREQIVLSQSRRGQQGTRAAENVGTDHLTPAERALKEGRRWINPDQSTPWVQGVSPMEHLAISDPLGQATSEFQYGRGTNPYDVFAGLQRPPIMTQGETFPGMGASVFPEAPLTPREQLHRSSMRAGRDVPIHPLPSEPVRPAAAKPAPAAEPAGPPVKATKKVAVKDIRPSIDIDGKRVYGKYGETHQDILKRWSEGKTEDEIALATMDFDSPENPNYFIDKGGNRISRDQLKEWHGFRDSQKLREAQGWKPPKTKPVEPAPAAAGRAEQVAELERLKEVAEEARQKNANMWNAKSDYPYKVRKKVRDASYAASDAVDKAWEALYGSRLTGKNEAGQTFSEWLLGITEDYKKTIRDIEAQEAARANKAPTKADVEPEPAPVKPQTPPEDARPRVRVQGKFGWEEAVVVGREGDTLHVQISDPIFGDRTTSVLASDTRPVAGLQKPLEKGGVPFQDVKSVALNAAERAREERGGENFASMDDDFGPPGLPRNEVPRSAWMDRSGNIVGDRLSDAHEMVAQKVLNLSQKELRETKNANILYDKMREKGYTRVMIAIEDGIVFFEDKVMTSAQRSALDNLAADHEFLVIDGRDRHVFNYRDAPESHGSIREGSGPAKTKKTLKGGQKWVLEIQEALDLLPSEPRALLAEILHQVNVAVKRDMPIHFERDMAGAKGASYVESGRIGINLHWLNGVVQNWGKMSPASQTDALMKMTALLGHEVTHTVHRFAERSGMAINGVPVSDVIVASVNGMSPTSRQYVAEQILKAKGEKHASQRVIDYLSGDKTMIEKWYSQQRGRKLSPQEVDRLAAGEVMAEIGSIELVKRMNVQGLPQTFRDAVDRFKQVLINTVKWFAGKSQGSDIAALQNLESIASKMYDHFGAADEHGLAKAFPTSKAWKAPPVVNPFSSGAPVPPGVPGSTVTVAPDVEVLNGALLKTEMLRLGVRGAVGATIGAFAGPAIAPNQISTAEGIIIGGIAGMFGKAVAGKLLSGNLSAEAAAALKAHPRNPIKALGHIMGGGKTLQELGLEGRHGWTGIGSSMAKFVRQLEKDFDLNLDPKLKALMEDARGAGAEQFGIVNDALEKVRWFKPNPTMIEAVGHYFEGRISKNDFEKLLTSPELVQYGNFITTAREAMTNLSTMFADGLPKSAFKTHVMDTAETYLGKFYTAFTDGKFKMEHFDAAKKDMMAKLGYSDETANELMLEYMREVHANRKQFSTGRRGESGEKYDTSTLMRRMATTEEIQGQEMVVAGLEHNKHGADYIRERKKLDWMLEHKITDNWRLWLGEIEDPLQRMVYTIQKVHASAISGKTFDLLDTMSHTNGNRFSYTPTGLVQQRALLESEIKVATPDKIAGLQERLRDLNGYGPIPQGAAYGKLSGKWVDRFTRDTLNTYDSPYQWMEQPIIRSLAEFNNLIKIGHTAYNPLTVMRNYLQAPIMGLIARTNWGDAAAAWKEIHYTKGEDYRLMMRKHIIGSDFATSELSKGPGTVFSGYLDSDIAVRAGKEAHRAVLKGYQQPDMITRAAAFISARKRIAQEALDKGIKEMQIDPISGAQVEVTTRFAGLQDAMNHAKVVDDAVAFTNRYTMNYSTVPAIVKAGRQLPFINLYISYTAEITRILKNLTEDMIKPGPNSAGRMHAITTLAAMAAIPTVMTMGGRSLLSDRDRKDWDQVEALSPHYNRSRFRIPYKREADGRFRYFDITNLLPADNFSQMTKAMVQGDTEAFWKANPLVSLQNTPLLNMATEQVTGEDIRTGQSIEGFGRVREILKEVLPPIVPPGYEGQRLQRAFSTNIEGNLGLTNMRTGVQYRPSDIVANYMTGMRFGNVMLSTMQKGAISQAKQQIAEQQQLMRETTNMDAGADARMRAQEIYNKAVEQIMLDLHSKMPVTQQQ